MNLAKILADHNLWLKGQGGARANLYGADLSGAHLSGAHLYGANLTRANLYGATLTGANLYGATLSGATLSGATLSGANLSGADLAGARLTGANLARANLTGANLTDANLTRANLTGANLADAYLARARGIRWGQIGPVGQGRRLLTAWAHDSLPEPVITGGCFRGTFAEFRQAIAGCPWDWGNGTESDRERWRVECSEAADWLESKVA